MYFKWNLMNVTTCVNLLGKYHLIWPQGMKLGQVGGVTAEAVPVLLKEIRLFIHLSEAEYNDNCQDQYSCCCQDIIKKFESHTG